MADYTANYQLHQWQAEDSFLRADFNQDFQKIDAALAQKNGVVFGTYTGDGAASQAVALGFSPKLLYTCTRDGKAGSSVGSGYCYGGLAAPGHPVKWGSETAVEITQNGFCVYRPHDYIRSNQQNTTYHYIAFI